MLTLKWLATVGWFRAWLTRRWTRDRLLRSFFTRVSGSLLSQALLIAATPILTRLYQPADFGVQAVYTACLAAIGVIAGLGYQQAIPLPEDDTAAAGLLLLSFGAALGVAGVSAAGVALFAEPIAALMGAPALAAYLWVLPLGVLVTAGCQLGYQAAVRRRAMARLARVSVLQSAAAAAAQVGAAPLGAFGLIGGRLAGQLAALAAVLQLPVSLVRGVWPSIRWPELARLGRRYWRFPAFNGAAAIVTKLTEHLPAVLFAALFGPAAAGFYALARRVSLAPLAPLGHSIADVLGAQVGPAHRAAALGPLVRRVYRLLAAVAAPPLIVLAASGPELFGVVFGAQWRAAGEFARWLTPCVLLQVIVGPLHYCFSALRKQALFAVYQTCALAALIGGLLLGSLLGDQYSGVGAASLLAAGCYFLLTWHLFRLTRLTFGQALAPLLLQALLGLLLALPAIAAAASGRAGLTLAGAGVTAGLLLLRYAHLFRARRNEEPPPAAAAPAA